MEDVLIKREVQKTKKYIEINNYSKEDIIKFLEAKIELSEQVNDEIALNASKKMLEDLTK